MLYVHDLCIDLCKYIHRKLCECICLKWVVFNYGKMFYFRQYIAYSKTVHFGVIKKYYNLFDEVYTKRMRIIESIILFSHQI
jgi:hypothetical protein